MPTKDKFEVFDVNLQRLDSLIGENQFSNCFTICADLTRYSAMSGYADGLLISEVLEGVFSQMASVVKTYEISNEEKHRLASELKNGISKIKNSYRNDDKNLLYNGLKKIRSDATYFQFECRINFSHRPRKIGRSGELV